MNAFPWTILFILLAAGMLGTLAVLPYSLAMNPKLTEKLKATTGADNAAQPDKKAKKLPPMPVMILASVVQGGVMVGVLSFLGLLAAAKVALGLPILQAALQGLPVKDAILALLPMTMLLAVVSGVVMLVIEAFYFMPRIPRALAGLDHRTSLWKRILACFYGGVVEEILLRLFVMSGLVWLIGLVWKTPAGAPTTGAYWLAIFLAAILFGLGHLPATAGLTKLTPMVIFRAVLLNGIPGVACGYLYMRYGLEAAMLCHFTLDIILHLLSVPVMRRVAGGRPSEPVAEPA